MRTLSKLALLLLVLGAVVAAPAVSADAATPLASDNQCAKVGGDDPYSYVSPSDCAGSVS